MQISTLLKFFNLINCSLLRYTFSLCFGSFTSNLYSIYLFIYLFIALSSRTVKEIRLQIHMIRDGVAYNRARLQTRHAPKMKSL